MRAEIIRKKMQKTVLKQGVQISLKKFDTPLIDGMKAYYNFTKKHSALQGRTPAQASLIEVDGKNKWKTIIQNASLHRGNLV